jgi:hypothetical protein
MRGATAIGIEAGIENDWVRFANMQSQLFYFNLQSNDFRA